MSTFAKFTENNEWEGETWHFWLQVEGNEEALRTLRDALGPDDDDDPEYALDLDSPQDEATVDALVANADGGYMASHNKVVGTLVLPPNVAFDGLYKGGVRDLFAASREAS